jgi:hypothetical protein
VCWSARWRTGGLASDGPAQPHIQETRSSPTQGAAATVTAYVQRVLSPRVLQVEGALATANRQVLTHCQPPEGDLARCTDLSSRMGGGAVVGVLTTQALVLSGASHSFDTLLPPNVGALPRLQLRSVSEDLALFSDQLAGLLQESVAAVSSSRLQQATFAEPAPRVSYGPRVRCALTILRRAEAWLEAIDRESAARAMLPGFAPGAPSLENQLALQ